MHLAPCGPVPTLGRMKPLTKKHSKFLSLILRHAPETANVRLDAHGWVSVPELLGRLKAKDSQWSLAGLQDLVASSEKQRFELSADASRIRARQGHSLRVDLELEPQQPPELLFHGTVPKFIESIRAQGLLKGSRQHVHLSADVETARKVGQRRGKAVILHVRSRDLCQSGVPFFLSSNGVWLVDHVPAAFILG